MPDALLIYPSLAKDPVIRQLARQYQLPVLPEKSPSQLFTDLIESIISQQLSTKVAEIILERVYQLVPDRQLDPEPLLALDANLIRGCGVSFAKIRYIKAAAAAAIDGTVDFASLPTKTDQDIIDELTTIPGVGQWTAEMLLIFSLRRPDVFSVGDLGLRTAVARLYGIDRDDRQAILALAEQWSPHRSTASRYLWRSLDNQPARLDT